VIRQAISCDICASEKKQTNHWFVAYEQTGELRVSGWNSRNRLRPGSKHLCGQTCLHKLVDEFMANAIAVRPGSFAGDDADVDEFMEPVQARPESHVGARPAARAEFSPAARSEFSSDLRVAARPEPLGQRRPAPRPEAQREARPEARLEARLEDHREARPEAAHAPAQAIANFELPSSPRRRNPAPKARSKSAVAKMVESYVADAGLTSDSVYEDPSPASNPVSHPVYSSLSSSSTHRASTPAFGDEFESSARLVSLEEAIAIKRSMADPYQTAATPQMQTVSSTSFDIAPRPVVESMPTRVISSRARVEEPQPLVEDAPRYASRNWRAEAWEREREREREQRAGNPYGKLPARRRVN
jgi:hypothetical protein